MSTNRKSRRRRTNKKTYAGAHPGATLGASSATAATLGVAALWAAGGAHANPPLPTPCVAGNCGSSASSFVTYGAAGVATSGNTMNVNQSSGKAILNWANFNIANGYQVKFNQPGSTSETLNNIWSSDPSHIAGQLNSNGQVYLINQNGIVFDKGAQVNVGGLIASTLGLSANLFEAGILSGQAGAGACSGNTNCLPAVFQGGTSGSVTVSPGATLTAADGGRIMLLAPTVTNQGAITTPDGQTILGAGTEVYLAASSDPSMRGLLIEVNANGTPANGTATNQGQITAARGNVTIAGLVVNQQGRITATTSVNSNGSIYLVAGDAADSGTFYNSSVTDQNGNHTAFGGLAPTDGGAVTLAPGSVTQIQPDATDTGTVTEGGLSQGQFIASQVDVMGKTVVMQGNASIRAPGGTVNLIAAANPEHAITKQTPADLTDGSRIYLDGGSSIDVSGLTNVSVPVTNNLLNITLESGDLQDDPLQRAGFLHGLNVTVDIDRPLPTLFNATSYINNISLGINQILTQGGGINLLSRGDVITRSGSTQNVSGGSIAYQGGYGASTTKLIGADGKVYDINTAPNNIQYVGLANNYSYTDPTWGTKTAANAQTYYSGYLSGKNAGQIDVSASQVYLAGSMLAQTVAGPYQRSPSTLALGGSLVLGCNSCADVSTGGRGLEGGVTFADGAQDTLSGDFASIADLPAGLVLSPTQLSQGGFNKLTVYSDGGVTLPAATTLKLAAGGALTVAAGGQIDIDGTIDAPGGVVSLATSAPFGDYAPRNIELGKGSIIDVSGQWINDSPLVTLLPGTAPTVINGGKVTLNADGNVDLAGGSLIDVSGGGWINSSNKLAAGNAGAISLTASLLPANQATIYTGAVEIDPAATLLGASLSGGTGGTLSVSSGSVTIGSTASGTPGELLLNPDFFRSGGFGNYNVSGQNDLVIGSADPNSSESLLIAPIRQNLLFTSNSLLQPTGANLASFASLQTLPAALRSPVNLSFAATSSTTPGAGSLLLSKGVTIDSEPGGNTGSTVQLTASSTGNLTVLGDVIAPAGNISLQLGPSSAITGANDLSGYIPTQQLFLGPDALLSAVGYAQITDSLNAQGYRQGSMLDGGKVSLQAYYGYVVTAPGSTIDVSGTAGVIDILGTGGVTPTTVAGNAGTIAIDSRQGIVLQGSLLGHAATSGGTPIAGAGGGSVSVGLDLFDFGATNVADTQANGNAQGPLPIDRTLTLSGTPAADLPTDLQQGTAQISSGTLQSGGFDNITVKSSDILVLDGTFSLLAKGTVTLDAPLMEGAPGSSVTLGAAHVSLGNYFNQVDYFDLGAGSTALLNPAAQAIQSALTAPTGTATVTANAQLIDVNGQSGWLGFSSETLASTGDIRLGSPQVAIEQPLTVPAAASSMSAGLNTSGKLTLQAGQVYPTTATSFTLNVPAVTIAGTSATPATPLSAAGSIWINATTIDQDGVLRAPLGQITLNADSVTLGADSTTSVSANGMVIPYGSTANGLQWTYNGIDVATPPAKQISITGSNIDIQSGANVDLSGGGDLYAYEFVAGPGGSKDVLNPTGGAYTYAILPSLGSAFAPLDSQYQHGAKATGQTVYLSGVPGLAAGYYALLPSYYALLPGAYAIQVVTKNSDIAAGSVVTHPDGSYSAAARFGVSGTDVLDSRTSTVLITPDSVVRTQSQYTDSYANTFFSSAAASAKTATPSLPADAGQLILSGTSMTLDGSVALSAGSYTSGTDTSGKPITQQGLGGVVSILADNIVVTDCSVSSVTDCSTPGTLYLDTRSLDKLGAETLVLGATLQNTSAGEQVSVTQSQSGSQTQSVTVENSGTALTGPEIILAATGQVVVNDGAQIQASGTYSGSSAPLIVQGAGALLRAASGGSAVLQVGSSTPQGTLSIGAATLGSSGTLQLYTTQNLTLSPNAAISAANLGLYSTHVNLGDAPAAAGSTGLDLTSQLLTGLGGRLTGLTIGSGTTIDFYGNVKLGTADSPNPNLQNLTLDAQGLGGYATGTSASEVDLQAGTITFANSTGVSPTDSLFINTGGIGSLQLTAKSVNGQAGSGQITLGAGDKTISGFATVNISADADIFGQGGILTISDPSGTAVPVTLTSARLLVASGADQTISTQGAVTIQSSGSAPNTAQSAAPVGGKLTIQGSEIAQGGVIDLPAGILTLHATGTTAGQDDVTLGGGSVTAAAGASKLYYDTYAVAAGGQISLVSDNGNVTLANGATVDVSGATSADGKTSGAAGSLTVSAATGQFAFAGSTVKGAAAAGQLQGNFTLDVNSLGGGGFSALNTMLSGSGFGGAIALRSRGDSAVTIGASDVVNASSFLLEADHGSIDVAGSINTSGGNAINTNGGTIALWSEGALTLEPTAVLRADAGTPGPVSANGTAAASHGGNITLGSEADYINFVSNGGSHPLISMAGGGDSSTVGMLTLRALSTPSGVQIASQGVEVDSGKPVVVEAYSTYSASILGTCDSTNGGCAAGTLDVADLSGAIGLGAQSVAANVPAISSSLDLLGGTAAKGQTAVQVRAGVEVTSTGDLALTTNWNLDNWSASLALPVNVTLRAAGDLIFQGSLSDGFTSNGGANVATWTFGKSDSTADSATAPLAASYRLAAGADLSASDPLAVVAQAANSGANGLPATGNLVLTPGKLIRTGDGNIDIAAGGDVLLGYVYSSDSQITLPTNAALTSVIYTAGLASAPVTSFAVPAGASYPTSGGNITVSAADDILSNPSAQFPSNWLYRQGTVTTASDGTVDISAHNTSWYVVFANFQQGIGALGGGDIALNAGGNIVDVSAVIPTTGRLSGAAGSQVSAANLQITGGGNLLVQAGGDVDSGVFETDLGNALIRAGGALDTAATLAQELPNKAFPDLPIFPVLLLGSGTFDVDARGEITINMAGNSTALPEWNGNCRNIGCLRSYFYTFAPTATLNVLSAGGNVTLQDNMLNLPIGALKGASANANVYDGGTFTLEPPTMNVAALSGDINVSNTLNLYPSATGNLNLLAAGNIFGDSTAGLSITMYESDPSLLANPLLPQSLPPTVQFLTILLPLQPLHQDDDQLIHIVAASGDIARSTGGSDGVAGLVFPKAAEVIAGGDIADFNYFGKNLHPSDVTLIEAGGDIAYTIQTLSPTDPTLVTSNFGITLGGPGYLEVLAGGTINLADSNGLQTRGALQDPRLPATGASIITGAGLGTNADGSMRQPATQSFITRYLTPDSSGAPSAYADTLVSFMEKIEPDTEANVSYATALTQFEALSPAKQLPLLSQVLSDELSVTGIDHNTLGLNYDRGYTAINTLFPTKDAAGQSLTYQGDIDLFFSQLKTDQGGDINILAPGGSVVVGLENPPAELNSIKTDGPADLGILALGDGAIEGFADQSFIVNQSRILTLEGGDIILWASNGNIDAGRGAKSASAAPPPIIQTDANGHVVINASNTVTGSGIGQLVSTPGKKAGLVNLIAPKGAVDAGDAGIRVAGNLNIAAVIVIGAGNITVGGTSTGVPVSEAGALSGALSGANSLGDAGKGAVDQLNQSLGQGANYQQLTDSLQPSFITVKMFCLGVECETSPQ